MTLKRKIPAIVAVIVLILAGLAAAGGGKGEKSEPLPEGVWALKGGELTLQFSGKDQLKVSPHGKDEIILVVCRYSAAKGGVVKATITALEGKAQDKAKDILPVGAEFSFTWRAQG